MTELLQWARTYHALGLTPIPLRQGKPLVSWGAYTERLATPEEV